MKKILIIGFSQTGQLNRVLDSIASPLIQNPELSVTRVQLHPQDPYPFPWPIFSFFQIFPECIMLDAPPNQPDSRLDQAFDLIILGYQPWFLSPSLPTTAFLKSEQGRTLLKNTPVITVIGCRNMWGQAHLKVKTMLNDAGAQLIDNVVLQDQGSSLATFITTPRWLLTGKKQGLMNLPPAGISDADIQGACRFGHAISQSLPQQNHTPMHSMLTGLGAVKANTSLLQSEKIGARSFYVWGKLIRSFSRNSSDWQRKPVLVVYILFLITMIITVVPLSLLIRSLIARLSFDKIHKLEHQFEEPSGSDTSRMKDFSCH